MRIKNWESFQHYKSGRGAPPWIKLHRGLLNDKEWHRLNPDAAKFLVSAWMIAAEYDGNLPDSDTLAFRLRIAIKDVEKFISICSHWIIDDASNALSHCYQVATPETETETETETYKPEAEKDKRAPRFDAQAHLVEIGVSESVAADWLTLRKAKKAPPTLAAINGVAFEASKAGISLSDALSICCSRGWAGFNSTWDYGQLQNNRPMAGKSQRDIERDEVSRILCGSQPALPERIISGDVIHAS